MKYLFGLLTILVWFSCAKKTDSSPSFVEKEGTVTRISVTNSVTVGQDVNVTVDFLGAQLCDEALRVERTQSGKTVTIKAFYKHPNTQAPCLDSPAQLQQSFTFKPLQTGQFIFKWENDANIADTLSVF